MLNDAAVRFFTDLCSREVLDQVEAGKWLPEPWSEMRDLGLVGAAVMPLDEGVDGLPLKSLCTLARSEEHTSELQSLMRISYAVFCLKNKITTTQRNLLQLLRTHE